MSHPSENPKGEEVVPAAALGAAERQRASEFRSLYYELVPKLVAFLIVTQSASRREGAECAHEALVELHLHRDEVRHPRAWCRKVAERIFLRRKFDAVESFDEIPASGAPLYASDQLDREETGQQREQILDLVKLLPYQQRRVMTLVLEGLGYADVAFELDLPESTVRSHARHARDRLADLYRRSRDGKKGAI